MCSDFASTKDREEAANLIADAAYRARSHVEKINGIHEQFNRGFDSIKQVFEIFWGSVIGFVIRNLNLVDKELVWLPKTQSEENI